MSSILQGGACITRWNVFRSRVNLRCIFLWTANVHFACVQRVVFGVTQKWWKMHTEFGCKGTGLFKCKKHGIVGLVTKWWPLTLWAHPTVCVAPQGGQAPPKTNFGHCESHSSNMQQWSWHCEFLWSYLPKHFHFVKHKIRNQCSSCPTPRWSIEKVRRKTQITCYVGWQLNRSTRVVCVDGGKCSYFKERPTWHNLWSHSPQSLLVEW